MWPMIAEPGLRCAECRHHIQPGRLCLSELPEETPSGVSRRDFQNYCIGCPECWRQGKHACYVRYLEAGGSTGKTPRSLPCARCGRRIGAGEKAGVDRYYEWPEAVDETAGGQAAAAVIGAATAVAGVDTLIRGVPNGSFSNLSDGLQQKLVNAGLGGERGVRTLAEAQGFYQDSIPYPIRNLGEGATRQFLDGKDASHIQSAQNAPHLADHSGNLLWENSGLNRARGTENMTGREQWQANASNAFDASTIVFRECLQTGAMAAFYAALLESPVAAVENYYHYQRGRKTGEEAVKDAALSIAQRGATGFVAGFAVTAAVALIPGAAPLLVTIAPFLLPVGMGLYGYSALKRIERAMAYDLPLHQVGTYFCSSRCHTRFAWETGYSALMRWEESRKLSPTEA